MARITKFDEHNHLKKIPSALSQLSNYICSVFFDAVSMLLKKVNIENFNTCLIKYIDITLRQKFQIKKQHDIYSRQKLFNAGKVFLEVA